MKFDHKIIRAMLPVMLVLVLTAVSYSQGKVDIGKAIAQKGSELSLYADKSLLDAKETTTLTVRLIVPPAFDESGVPMGVPEEIDLPRDGSTPYKAANWRIVEGGGSFDASGIGTYSTIYVAPAKAPLSKQMTISVDLLPQMAGFPKVVMLKTLYFVENETAVFVSMSQIGLVDTKFVSKQNGGAKIPTLPAISPAVAAKLPPDVLQKMKEAQIKAKQLEMDVDITALASNASAYYDPVNKFTSLRFTALTLSMAGGKPAPKPGRDAVLTITYDGNALGTFPLGRSTTSSVGLFLTAEGRGLGCGDTQSDTEKYPCEGEVTITTLDGDLMKGSFKAAVFTSVGDKIYRGAIYGKFTAKRANS